MSFSHRDPGTPESQWVEAGLPGLGEAPGRDGLTAQTLLVVAVAHPDDETLGATGLVRAVLAAGGRVRVLVASAGERSHPDSPTHTPERLVRLREAELAAAVEALGTGHGDRIDLVRLGLPDGGLAAHTHRVEAAVGEAVDGHRGPVLLATHYRRDGHADHDALGHALAGLAARHGLGLYEFPIWFWHWADPARDTVWRDWARWTLTERDLASRAAALQAHASQVRPLSPAPGDEAILGPGMLEHFTGRPFDVYGYTPPPGRTGAGRGGASETGDPADSVAGRATEVFDRLYRDREDPWDYRGSWYERRKRGMTLAALPRERYGTVVEAGSSIGVLTAELAGRAQRVLGLEASGVAVEVARRALADRPGVQVVQAVLPGQWPRTLPGGGPADAVVLSEIGYFLSAGEVEHLMDRIEDSLSLSGHLVLCHWRQPVEGWPLDGDDVHQLIARNRRFRLVSRHREPDFSLDVLARRDAADRVAVVVPVRNEEARLPRCLQAVARAADRWEETHAQGSVRIVVALDHCTDASARVAQEFAYRDPRIHVLDLAQETGAGTGTSQEPAAERSTEPVPEPVAEPAPEPTAEARPTVGRARDLGLRRAVDLLPGHGDGQRTWVASTDADTVVPEDWLVAQGVLAAHAGEAGDAGEPAVIAGTVGLDLAEADAATTKRWRETYAHAEGHGHVHGANLGMSWAVYCRLGGFPHVAEHEDLALVEAARAAGVPVLATDRIRVLTSARTTGRTPGGFAGFLRHLVTDAG